MPHVYLGIIRNKLLRELALTVKLGHLLAEDDLPDDSFDLWLVDQCDKPSVEMHKILAEVHIQYLEKTTTN